ncbi:MAG: hypothetical protein O7C72_08605 [Deltaproteobacteria bacterium]|nr:hypothetical protein [Deltaproteobacteria bacterium]
MPSYLPSLAEIADWARLRELRGDFLFRPSGIRVDLWEGGKKTIPSLGPPSDQTTTSRSHLDQGIFL